MSSDNTKEKIREEAVKEFLQSGFLGASLRKIVKNVGLTTGAFYRYYPNKEALFADLVEEHANYIYGIYDHVLENFQKQDAETQTQSMTEASGDGIEKMLDYIYAHYDNFKLLLTAADGTPYTDFLHNLAVRETASTMQYMDMMRENGFPIPEIDKGLVHMISSGMFSGIFEIVIHDVDKETAMKRIQQLKKFYTGGWERLFEIRFGEKEGKREDLNRQDDSGNEISRRMDVHLGQRKEAKK